MPKGLPFDPSMLKLQRGVDNQTMYKLYELSGDFEKDFVSLCALVDMEVDVAHRVQMVDNNNTRNVEVKRRLANTSSEPLLHTQREESSKPIRKLNIEISTERETCTPDEDGEKKTNRRKEKVHHPESVTGIYMRNSVMDSVVIDVLSKTTKNLSHLTVLHLWNIGLRADTLYSLKECLTLIPSLRRLRLDGNRLAEGNHFETFIRQPSPLKLRHFSLKHCGIDGRATAHLARALSDNKYLLTLNLCFNDIGDEGAMCLAKCLRTNCSLLSLDVGSNGITNAGVKCIADVLMDFPLTHEETILHRHLKISNKSKCFEPEVNADPSVPAKAKTSSSKNRTKVSKSRKSGRSVVFAESIDSADPNPEKDHQIFEPLDTDFVEHRFLDVTHKSNGQIWVHGNTSLVNLNLSRNRITGAALTYLFSAVEQQQQQHVHKGGLTRLSLKKNLFSMENQTYVDLMHLFKSQ